MDRRQIALLDKLVSSQRPALVRFLSRKLGSVDDAQEVAQDAFLRLHRLENPEELDDARAFLFSLGRGIQVHNGHTTGSQP